MKQTTVKDLKIQFCSQQEWSNTGFTLVWKHCDAASMGTWSGENFSFRTCLTNESSHRNGQASQTSTPELIHGGNFPLSAIRQISDKSVPSEEREGGHFIPESFPDGANITYYFLLNILVSWGCNVTDTSTFDYFPTWICGIYCAKTIKHKKDLVNKFQFPLSDWWNMQITETEMEKPRNVPHNGCSFSLNLKTMQQLLKASWTTKQSFRF